MNRNNQNKFLQSDNMGQSEIETNNNYSLFDIQSKHIQLLSQPNYKNQNNNIHNNIGSNVLLEQIYDNKIFIDTKFKDHTKHDNPYKFIVKFNGIDPKTEMVKTIVNNNSYEYQKYIDGDTTIVIDRVFKNVKSITIDTLFMPPIIDYVTQDDGSYKSISNAILQKRYKYLILKIHELHNDKSYSNNKSFGRESFVMKIDDDSCFSHHRWTPISKQICYPLSQLNNINKLTIEICDNYGNTIVPTLDNKPYDFFKEYKKIIDNFVNNRYTPIEIVSIEPKLNSLKEIIISLYPELHMTISTLESQINTSPQFRV